MDAAPAPVTEDALRELRQRLRATRFVAAPGSGWDRGTDPAYLRDLVAHWAESYDWRAAEARISALPWQRAGDLRVLHQPGPAGAPVVVLLHGWPDSVLRFERVLPLLADLTVVVPALPGYPFSNSPGMAGADMADPVAAALTELGYERFTVSAGDVGTGVAEALARRYPDRVAALHLTDVSLRSLALVPPAELTDEERAFQRDVAAWLAAEGAYTGMQATKPATLAPGLGDSPAGLAAWLVEKYRSWSDCGGDVETAFPRDDLLTWVSAYWFTGAIGTSFAPYSERRPPEPGRVAAPTVVSVFAHDLLHPPRSAGDRVYDVRAWHEHAAGGHFAAWEQPEAWAADLRSALAFA